MINKYQNQSVNRKIWDLIRDESGKSEGRYEFVAIYSNGKRISDPTHVAKFCNTYLPRQQNGYNVILFLGHLSIVTVIKNFVLQYFLPANKYKITTTIRDLKNKKIKWTERVCALIHMCHI
jgi:hypothetical protein